MTVFGGLVEIHVYDFDGTLFRSPAPPSYYGGPSWYVEEESLDVPCVPVKPSKSWWVGSTLTSARQSLADPNVYSVMLTGRSDGLFRWRVPELLHSVGLSFDQVRLNPGNAVARFKSQVLVSLARRFPQAQRFVFWDDNKTYLNRYQTMLERAGFIVETHLVRVPSRKCVDLPQAKSTDPVEYTEAILSKTSHKKLLRWWEHNVGPLLPEAKAQHMTIQYKPSEGTKGIAVGQRVSLQVQGWAASETVQVVAVAPSE